MPHESKVAKDKKTDAPEKERRILNYDDTELRVTGDGQPKITGYAAKYGKWSLDLGGFTERIQAGAFDEVMEKSDVRALKNHDPNLLLGRTTSGTLRLKSNTVGLNFEIDPPDTNNGRDIIEEIRRKDITGCSFAFTVEEDEWKNKKDGSAERTITKVRQLFDVGPVTFPAYPDTDVAVRSLEKFREERKKKYECECIECGHIIETNDHCKDIVCLECGGQMRRKERPGPGRSEEKEEKLKRKRQRDADRKYRKAGRIIDRNKSAEV